MIAALSFLLDFEKIEDNDSDDSDSQDDQATPQPQVFLSKEAIYKVCFILSTVYRLSNAFTSSSTWLIFEDYAF